MMTTPEFSIVIPCRDDQENLVRAVRSVLNQQIAQLEVIVVDDGSDPPLVLHDDPRIRLIRQETAGGPAAARNAGLAVARGRFIGFCDSDDMFTGNRLADARQMHRSADVAIVAQSRVKHRAIRRRISTDIDSVLDQNSPHLGATTVRRELCPSFDKRYLACQDIEWWVRLIESHPSFSSTETVGYLVGDNVRTRVLNSPMARLEFSYSLLCDHRGFFAQHRRALAFRWLRIAVMERRQGTLAMSRLALARSLRARPSARAWKELIRLVAALRLLSKPPARIDERPLAVMAQSRRKCFVPLRRGPLEARQIFRPAWFMLLVSTSAILPRHLRGRVRRAGTLVARNSLFVAETPWGKFPVDARETRLLAPYVDEILETALLARLLAPGMAAVDIGANRGWYSLVFSRRVGHRGRVLAVEPDLRMIERLQNVRNLNQLEGTLAIAAVAVGGATEPRSMVMSSESSLNHLATRQDEWPQEGQVLVPCVSFFHLVREHGFSEVDLVKIDVEGFGLEVLQGIIDSAKKGLAPSVVMFEYEPEHWRRSKTGSFNEAFELLVDNYRLFFISYETGGLEEVIAELPPRETGRNILALRRKRCSELLSRIGLAVNA